MRTSPDAEDLVSEPLSDSFDTCEIQNDLANLVETVKQATRFRARHEAYAESEQANDRPRARFVVGSSVYLPCRQAMNVKRTFQKVKQT